MSTSQHLSIYLSSFFPLSFFFQPLLPNYFLGPLIKRKVLNCIELNFIHQKWPVCFDTYLDSIKRREKKVLQSLIERSIWNKS